MLKQIFYVILGVLLIVSGMAMAQTTTYQYSIQDGNNQYHRSLVVTKTDNGFNTESFASNPDTHEAKSKCKLDDSYATVQWNFTALSINTMVNAVREGNTIHISGTVKGKSYDKIEKINLNPWFQEWPTGCAELVRQGKKEFYFFSFYPKDVTKFTKFKGTLVQEEMLMVNGKELAALHYKISLAGILAPFWSGNYWFSKIDGDLLRYEDPLVSELVSKSIN